MNVLEHMWGHLSVRASAEDRSVALTGPRALLAKTQAFASRSREPFMYASKPLSELALYVARKRLPVAP